MTLSELGKWRKYVPATIFALCILPWVVIRSNDLEQAKLRNEIIVPAISVVAAFFYVGLGLRRSRWHNEKDTYVGAQIRTALLELIPKDLEVTETEKQDLAQREIYKDLTGVFWEAVDRSPVLLSHKEHFYSNGIVYTTSIDVFLICAFMGFVYAVAYDLTADASLRYPSAALIGIAVICRRFVTPRCRKRHLELSGEQLDLLRRDQLEFVSTRFREIIMTWRRTRVLGNTQTGKNLQ